MKLIDEIINLLSSDTPDLVNALFKTKVLLHQLGEDHAVSWVNSELNGYPSIESIPEYRKVKVSIFGVVTNGYYVHNNQPIPVSHLKKELQDSLQTHPLTDSIAVIKSYDENINKIDITISPELFPKLGSCYDGGYYVKNAWRKLPHGCMLQVLTEVRSRLLDFILELSEKLPDDLDSKDMKEKSKEIGTSDIFNHSVFGDNTTIVIGNSNLLKINNSVIKNDLETLIEFFRNNGVDESDLIELKTAVINDVDSPEHSENKFGNNVRAWIKTMLVKATDYTWKIGLQISSTLLVQALNAYYGWN